MRPRARTSRGGAPRVGRDGPRMPQPSWPFLLAARDSGSDALAGVASQRPGGTSRGSWRVVRPGTSTVTRSSGTTVLSPDRYAPTTVPTDTSQVPVRHLRFSLHLG